MGSAAKELLKWLVPIAIREWLEWRAEKRAKKEAKKAKEAEQKNNDGAR